METEYLNRNSVRCLKIPMKMGSPETKSPTIIATCKNQPAPAHSGIHPNAETRNRVSHRWPKHAQVTSRIIKKPSPSAEETAFYNSLKISLFRKREVSSHCLSCRHLHLLLLQPQHGMPGANHVVTWWNIFNGKIPLFI